MSQEPCRTIPRRTRTSATSLQLTAVVLLYIRRRFVPTESREQAFLELVGSFCKGVCIERTLATESRPCARKIWYRGGSLTVAPLAKHCRATHQKHVVHRHTPEQLAHQGRCLANLLCRTDNKNRPRGSPSAPDEGTWCGKPTSTCRSTAGRPRASKPRRDRCGPESSGVMTAAIA